MRLSKLKGKRKKVPEPKCRLEVFQMKNKKVDMKANPGDKEKPEQKITKLAARLWSLQDVAPSSRHGK